MKNQPCKQDCPERKAHCSATCEKWAEYVKERDADYAKRKKIWLQGQVMAEIAIRHGKKLGQR